jgi:DNA-binding transcriptional LysR family regulator
MRQLKTFLRCGHVAVVGRGVTEDPVDAWLRQERLTRHVVLRVPSYSQALQIVAQSELVAFVPKRLTESLAKPLSLTLLPPPIDPGEYQEYLFHPRRTSQDLASIWLRNIILEMGNCVQEVASALLVKTDYVSSGSRTQPLSQVR